MPGQAMSKEEFKRRWEKDEYGDGITFDDIAECAIAWGITPTPRIRNMWSIRDQVIAAAGVKEE